MDIHALKNVLKFLSVIGMALSLFMLIPVLTGALFHEEINAFGLFVAGLFCFNGIIFLLLRHHTIRLSIRDGVLSVNLVWILLGIAGAVPLVLYTDVGWADAFFEAISGFTTTGATIYGDIEVLPRSVLMLRSLREGDSEDQRYRYTAVGCLCAFDAGGCCCTQTGGYEFF